MLMIGIIVCNKIFTYTKSTQSAAWCKKSLLATSLLAAIAQNAAIAAVTQDNTTDSAEQMVVTAPAPQLKRQV
jgi:hemoglobin/transferrin/lactoferrin receptor protein